MKKFNDIVADLAPGKFGKTGVVWIVFLSILVILGVIAYADQVIQGQKVTNMRDYALWGIYISNFVFFVATSFVGSATVAILRLTNNSWRTPLVRIAEIITLACIIMAGITITLDMARPDRVMNLFYTRQAAIAHYLGYHHHPHFYRDQPVNAVFPFIAGFRHP